MKIDTINIKGFGKLRDIVLEQIGPAVTCVYGLNEAGKTTLQNCISALLYGMKAPTHRRRHYEREHALFAPWDNTLYQAGMVYRLDSGERFEVRRTFWREEERTTIWDANGRDITATFPLDATKERTFAESHLGLTKNQFLDLCVFRQANVEEMRQGEALARKLESLVDTSSEDTTARDAVAKMDQALEEIGTSQATTKPLGRCTARLTELRTELARAQDKRRAVFEAAEKRRALTAALDGLRHKEKAARLLRKEAERREAQDIVAAVETLDRDIAKLRQELASLAPYEEFPADGQQSLLIADSRRRDLERRLRAAGEARGVVEAAVARHRSVLGRQPDLDSVGEDEVQRARENFAVLESKRQVRLGEERKLETLRAGEASVASELERLAPLREVLDREDWQAYLDTSEPDGQEDEALDLHRMAVLNQGERLEALKRKRSSLLVLSWLLLGCSAAAAAVFVAKSSKSMLVLLGLTLVGFVLSHFAQRTLKRRVQEKERLLAERVKGMQERERAAQERKRNWQGMLERAGVSSAEDLRALGAKLSELRGRKRELALKLEVATQGTEALTRESRELERRLIPLVQLSGLDTAGLTSEEMDAFLSIWSERAAVREKLNLALQEQAQRRKEEAQLRADLEASLTDIRSALAQAGVKSVPEFQEACRRHETHRRLKADLDAFLSRRAATLRDRSAEEWKEAARNLDEEAASLRGGAPAPSAQLQAGGEDKAKLQRGLASLEEEIHRHEVEISRLQGIEESETAGEREVVEIEEELEACAKQQAALLRRRDALVQARDLLVEISKSYHARVAPKLNEACGELVHRITGEYHELRVEPMESDARRFSINVRIPETGEFRPADVLSRGTIDQCYFILKLSILSLLTENKERPPLLLDDTFAHYDRRRRREAFRLLAEKVAARWQILYFTCHWHHAEEIRALLASPEQHGVGEFTLITTSRS